MPKLIFQKLFHDGSKKNIITTEIDDEEEVLLKSYIRSHPPVRGFYRYELTSDNGNLIYDCCISFIMDYIKDTQMSYLQKNKIKNN